MAQKILTIPTLPNRTVALLPALTAGDSGSLAWCTDAKVLGGTTGCLVTWDGAGWRDSAGLTPATTQPFLWQDRFIVNSLESGEVGYGWTFLNGSVAALNGASGRPGGFQRTSSATASQVNSMQPGASITNTRFLQSEWQELRMSMAPVASSTDFIVRLGVAVDASGNAPVNWVGIERLAADTAWFQNTTASSVSTRTSTGVSLAAGTWVDFVIGKSGTNITFTTNGVVGTTHTTNIPVAGTLLTPFIQVVPTTAAARSLNVGLMQFLLRF